MRDPASPVRRWSQDEDSVEDLLSDPACRLLMQRDGTSPQLVLALLDRVRATRQPSTDRFAAASARGRAA